MEQKHFHSEQKDFSILFNLLIENGIDYNKSQEIIEHIQSSDEWERLNAIQQISVIGLTMQMCKNRAFDGDITAYFKDIVYAASI